MSQNETVQRPHQQSTPRNCPLKLTSIRRSAPCRAIERVEEEPLMFSERHQASIIEFENFSSVKASRRRRTPVWINSSTWAFTFSTPASASTTGAVSEGAATRLASSSTVTLLTGANVSATRHAKIRREKLSITAWRYARPVEQADDGGVNVPHFVSPRRAQPNLRLRRMHAE